MSVVAESLRETFVAGTRLWRTALAIPLTAAVPEGLQHTWEAHIGMFASRAAFHTLAFDPTRLAFGSVKIAGLVLAIIAATLWCGGARWRQICWRPLLVAIVLQALSIVVVLPLRDRLSDAAFLLLNLASIVATLPLLLLTVGALIGDGAATLRGVYTTGWRRLPLLALLLVAAYVPGIAVHYATHWLAFGRPAPLVAVLMAFDAVWIGTMACWLGAASLTGYARSGTIKQAGRA